MANALRFGTERPPHFVSMYLSGPDDPVEQRWISNDGRTWTWLGNSGLVPKDILTDGKRGLQVSVETKTPSGSAIPPQMTISAILDDGSLVPLTQSGASPMNVYGPGDRMTLEFAIGPTGIVAMNDTTLWLGLPS